MLRLNLRPLSIFGRQLSTQTSSSEVQWKDAKPFTEIPSPGLSFLFKVLPGGELSNTSIVDLHRYFRKTFGSIAYFKGRFGAASFLFSYDPNDFEKVYRTEGNWPSRVSMETMDYYRNHLRKDVYKKNGLLGNDGEKWQEFRTAVNPVLMQPKTVELYVDRIDEVTKDLVDIVKKSRDNKNETPADFSRYVERWSLESIGTIALDTRLGVLQPSKNNKGDRLATLMDQMFDLSFQLEVLPSLWRYVSTPKFVKLMKIFDESTNITISFVEEAIKRLESQTENKPADKQGVLEKLLKVDRDIATVMSSDMLAVGVDTTSSAVKSLLYLLAKNPIRQDKLRKEIFSILPTKDTPLTADKLKHLPYLRACMKEAHRILPVVAGTVRGTTQDLVLQGYQIPKGTWVAMAGGLFMEDDAFYTKAKEFVPERWLKDDSHKIEGCKHAKETHPFVYLPFGFGPRMCVGKRFAELEIATFMIRFVREFEISWNYPAPKVRSTFINNLTGDLKFTLKDLKV